MRRYDMQVKSSYKVKILDYSNIFNDTLKVYREALSYIIEVVNTEWCDIEPLKTKSRFNHAEHLIHQTKDNTPKYDGFNLLFYKMQVICVEPVLPKRLALCRHTGPIFQTGRRINLASHQSYKSCIMGILLCIT